MRVEMISLSFKKRWCFKVAFWLLAAPAVLLDSQRLMSFAINCMYRFESKGA